MPRLLPPLNPLRAFEAAGRLGSFTKAAMELNVSHSAISRHVRGLEKRLNVHLFRTKNTGVSLTDQGAEYLSQITPALDWIADATEALSLPQEGSVTLTTESAIAQKWLVPRLANLKARHPKIDLRLSVSTQVADIDAHEFDIGLRYLRSDPAPGNELMFPFTAKAYAAPGFASNGIDEVDLMTLANGPLIEGVTFDFWSDWFRKAGLEQGLELELSHPLGALLSIQSAVVGLGAILMDNHLCEPELKSGALVEISPVQFSFGGYYLAVNSRAKRRKSVQYVCQWIMDECTGSVD